jgi:hypothetical protein
MGAMQTRKGTRRELEVAHALGGVRQPLSGALGGDLSGDVRLPNGWRVEVKARRNGSKTLYAWLSDKDVLAVRADRKPWLAVVPLVLLQALIASRNRDYLMERQVWRPRPGASF